MKQLLLAGIASATLLTSCVSYRKYEDTLGDRDRLQARVNLQADSLSRLQSTNQRVSADRLSLEDRNRLLNEELTSTRNQYNQLNRANEDLLKRYDRVLAQNQAELSASSTELDRLRQELSNKELALAKRERELGDLSKELSQRETDLNERIALLETDLSSTRNAVAAKESEITAKTSQINELRAALASKDAKLNALRTRMRDALTGFSASDLSIEERNGKVYLSLSQNLLFASGSKAVNAAGQQALRRVASALTSSPDVAITVEGHTDTDGTADMNWDLSTARATAVAKALIAGGVQPSRITAAGRGEYQPVADNATPDGKARNRRTEIILTPRLGELYELVVGARD